MGAVMSLKMIVHLNQKQSFHLKITAGEIAWFSYILKINK